MKKRNTWTLPLVIDPIDTICVQIQVPNDINHIAAFWGALEALNKAWNWQYTEDHKGSQTARVWQGYIDAASQQVRIGDNCMVDCNDIETCLASSATIAAINAAIAQNSADITTNQGAIITNANAIVTVQGRVTANETTLAQHTLDIAQNSADIALNTTLITDNANQIISLQNQVNSNDIELANHETRITALEQGGGGGGGGVIVVSEVNNFFLNTKFSHGGSTYVDVDFIYAIEATLNGNGTTIVEMSFNTSQGGLIGAGFGYYRIEVNGQFSGEFQINSYEGVHALTVFGLFKDLPAGLTRFNLQWRNTIYNMWMEQGYFSSSVFEISNASTGTIVTFDSNGYPYTETASNTGYLVANGNPDNCLNVDFDDYGEIEIDLGGVVEVGLVSADLFMVANSMHVWLWVDDVLFLASDRGVGTNAWEEQVEISLLTGTFGQVIRIGFSTSGFAPTVRMDNITVQALQ